MHPVRERYSRHKSGIDVDSHRVPVVRDDVGRSDRRQKGGDCFAHVDRVRVVGVNSKILRKTGQMGRHLEAAIWRSWRRGYREREAREVGLPAGSQLGFC